MEERNRLNFFIPIEDGATDDPWVERGKTGPDLKKLDDIFGYFARMRHTQSSSKYTYPGAGPDFGITQVASVHWHTSTVSESRFLEVEVYTNHWCDPALCLKGLLREHGIDAVIPNSHKPNPWPESNKGYICAANKFHFYKQCDNGTCDFCFKSGVRMVGLVKDESGTEIYRSQEEWLGVLRKNEKAKEEAKKATEEEARIDLKVSGEDTANSDQTGSNRNKESNRSGSIDSAKGENLVSDVQHC